MNKLEIFNHPRFGQVRIVQKDGQPWIVLKDVCRVLGISKYRDTAERLDPDERGPVRVDTLGGSQEMIGINESGLYNVVLRSDKPEAKPFRKWVTSEVLPSIRKNGGYIAGQETMSDAEIMAKALLVAQKTIESKQAVIEQMQPKALFADAVETSHTSILIGDLAKLLKQNGIDIGQNRLFDRLRREGYLCNRSGDQYNAPTQRSMEMGLFEVRERTINNPDGSVRITRTTKVTGKGQIYFINRYCGKQNNFEIA